MKSFHALVNTNRYRKLESFNFEAMYAIVLQIKEFLEVDMFIDFVDYWAIRRMIQYVVEKHAYLSKKPDGPSRHPQSYTNRVSLPTRYHELSLGILGETPCIVDLNQDSYSTSVTLANRQNFSTYNAPFVWIKMSLDGKKTNVEISTIAFPWSESDLSIANRDWILSTPCGKRTLLYDVDEFGMLILEKQSYVRVEEGIVNGITERTTVGTTVTYGCGSGDKRVGTGRVEFRRNFPLSEGSLAPESLMITVDNAVKISGKIGGEYQYLSEVADPISQRNNVIFVIRSMIGEWDTKEKFIYPE